MRCFCCKKPKIDERQLGIIYYYKNCTEQALETFRLLIYNLKI